MSFTSCSTAKPAVTPGPLNVEAEVRFALSKLALKMYCTPSFLHTAFTASATSKTKSRFSITHGPAIKVSGLPLPTITALPTFAKRTSFSVITVPHSLVRQDLLALNHVVEELQPLYRRRQLLAERSLLSYCCVPFFSSHLLPALSFQSLGDP